MSNLGKIWAGRVYGTNTGNLFIEFTKSTDTVSGVLRFMDSNFGLTVFEISGRFDTSLKITGKPIQVPNGVAAGDLEAEAILNSQGHLQGMWKTSLGTGGAFVAYPHDIMPVTTEMRDVPTIPEQMHIKNISLGTIRLFRDDVEQLFKHIKQDFTTGRLIVTYNAHGSEVTKYAEDFLLEANRLENLDYLKINIQEHEAYGINRVVVIELRAFGQNEVRVQGVQESWVIGKAESLATILRRHQNSLTSTYKKFGLNLNQIIFFAMLVAMPSIVTWQNRTIFAFVVFLLLNFLLLLHAKFIPNALIQMSEIKPTWFSRAWPSILSWIGGVIASLVASVIFYLLTKSSP